MVHRSRPRPGQPSCQRGAHQHVTHDESFQDHIQRSAGELALMHSSTICLVARHRAHVHSPRSKITWLHHTHEASQSWPVHVRDRLVCAFWPRARAGCGAWCFVARLDVVVQMLAKVEPDTVVHARPELSPFGHDESTCRPSSNSGQSSSACWCGLTEVASLQPLVVGTSAAALAGLLLLSVQQWCSSARDPPADCLEWLGCPCGGVNAPAHPYVVMYHSRK